MLARNVWRFEGPKISMPHAYRSGLRVRSTFAPRRVSERPSSPSETVNWGRRMDDDLLDALDWAISEGIVDPARIVIMGMRYGSYAVPSKESGHLLCTLPG